MFYYLLISLKKDWIVLQIGARYNYQIPLYFAKRNSLKAFYTDFHSSHYIFKIFNILPSFILVKRLKRISNRRLPDDLPIKFVKDNILYLFFRSQSAIVQSIFNRIKFENFGSANAIYTNMINDDIELLIEAKNKGFYIVHEVIINPNINKIYLDEKNKFPSLEYNQNNTISHSNQKDRDLIKLKLADKILVPSEYIYREIIKKGISKKIISIVRPYMSNRNLLELKTNPIKGRILFVGQVSILKGIHYFAEACRKLRHKKFNYEFVAAGKCILNMNNYLLNGPRYLGHLSKDELMKEYICSDVFVLPSLSDAFPSAHLEAMACGIPVIISNSSGSLVEDGVNGFVINPGESDILANKIMEIVENRSLRKRFSENARKKIQDYKISDFYKKLDLALN